MAWNRGYNMARPVKRTRRARYAKGVTPEWFATPGILVRAANTLVLVSDVSQVAGFSTVRPLLLKRKPAPNEIVIASRGEFGMFLGLRRENQLKKSKGMVSVTIPAFFFNGRRVTCVTLESFDDFVIADDEYDDGVEGG